MSTEETQIDWAMKSFDKASKVAQSDMAEAIRLIAVGLSHMGMEIRVMNYRLSRLEGEAGLSPLDD